MFFCPMSKVKRQKDFLRLQVNETTSFAELRNHGITEFFLVSLMTTDNGLMSKVVLSNPFCHLSHVFCPVNTQKKYLSLSCLLYSLDERNFASSPSKSLLLNSPLIDV